jgi:paraquat-inducible protein A
MLFRQTVTWRSCHAKPVQVTTQCSTKGYSMRRLVGIRPVLLTAAPFFLALGLVLPLIRFEKLYFFDETPSLVEIVASLWSGGDIPLALIVGIVSIVLPVLKIVGIAAEATAAGGGTGSWFYRHAVPYLSKWSMMDVLLVAIVVAAAKTTGLADAFTQPGLWCYATSTIISGLLHSLQGNASGPK